MKKILVVCAACLLSCFLVRAQGVDNSGRGVGLTVIPRIDLTPNFPLEKGGNGEFTFGDSSLYSLVEGNISDAFSFSIANHWLASDVDAIKALYQNTWRSDDVNWLDWAYLTFTTGNVSISAGKQVMTIGAFEFDAYDYEVHSFLNSTLWNTFNCYQWGAKVDWTNDPENTTLGFQVTTSPYGERPFSSKLFNYSAEWRGSYGDFENIWSITAVQRGSNDFYPVLSLGQRYTIEKATFGLDAFNVVGSEQTIMRRGATLVATLTYAANEQFNVTGHIVAEACTSGVRNKDLLLGFDANWFPIKSDPSFRVHAAAGWRHDLNMVSLTLGALYYLNIPRR